MADPEKGGVNVKITNYFGAQCIQVGDYNTTQIAELLSTKTDLKKKGLERDGLLQGALNSILNPKRSKNPNSVRLEMLDKKFTEIFGGHLSEEKTTFIAASGMSLYSFLQKHSDSYDMFTTTKGKIMVEQKLSGSKSNCQNEDNRSETEQKGNAVERNGSGNKSFTGQIYQKDFDSDDWEFVCSKRHKKKAKRENIKTEESASIGTQQHVSEDQGETFIRHLLERRSKHNLKLVPSEMVYFQNFLLYTIDVVSMWNTPKEASSFIILGMIDNEQDQLTPYTTTGKKKSHTVEDFKRIFLYECVVGSVPQFSYSESMVGTDIVGVIEISSCPDSQSPCIFNCNRRNNAIATREGDMWIQKDASAVVCKPTDDRFAEIYRWFAKRSAKDTHNTTDSVRDVCSIQGAEDKNTMFISFSQQQNGISKKKGNELKVCTSVDQMLDAVDNFRKGHFILLAGNVPSISTNMEAIASIPLLAVFDFDPYSRDQGLLCSNEEPLSKMTSLHITTWRTIDKPVSEYETNWCFIRGIRDDPESRQCGEESDDVRSWSRKIKRSVDRYLGDIQDFIADYTVVTSIVFWPNDERMIPYILKMIAKIDENIDPPPKLVIVCESEPQTEAGKTCFRTLCEEQNENLTLVRMGLSDVLSGLSHKFKLCNIANAASFNLPAADQRGVCILDRDASWLREHMYVLFQSCPFLQGENDIEFLQEESDNFYRGGTLHWRTWYSCGIGHFDIERDIYKNAKSVIEKSIQKNKSGMVTLCHAPGAGGTTLAQRLAWEFHEKVPTVHVRRNSINMLDIVSRIEFLYSKSHKPVLLLIDGEDDQKVFHLLQYIKSSCIAVILHVKRCLCKPEMKKEDTDILWLSGIVSSKEAKQLTLKLKAHCKNDDGKERTLLTLCKETEQGKRHHLINFGLTVFLHEFKGISSFVKGYFPVSEHNPSPTNDQRILLYLALAYFYGHTSIPCQFFNELLHLPANYCVDLDDFPQSVQSFVVEDEGEGRRSNIRICHNLVAKEILDHILSRGRNSKDAKHVFGLSEPARHRLASLCLEFISYASRRQGRSPSSSDTVANCLRKIFIVRDTMDMYQGSEHLIRKSPISNILMDINSPPPMFCERLEVLKKLVEAFPKDPNFLAHLGRFYANCLPQKEKEAEKCFIMSLELCEANTKGTNKSDGKLNDRLKLPLMYIYHMYGMFLLKRIKRETGNGIFEDVTSTSEGTKSPYSMYDLLVLVKQACSLFEKSRMYTPVGHESGYGYTGEIEVRLHFCDFLQKEETVSYLNDTLEICTIREMADVFVRKSIPIIDELINECTKESVGQKEICYFLTKYSYWYDHLFKGNTVAFEHMDECQDIDSCRLRIAMAKINSRSGPRSSCNIKEKKHIDYIVRMYEKVFEMLDVCDTYREKKTLETNLVDWLRAIRHKEMIVEYRIDQVLVQVVKISNLISSPVVNFYMFVLKSLLGFGICSESRQVDTSALYDAKQLKLELNASGRYVMKPKHPREWVGNSENGIKSLLPGSQCITEYKTCRHFPLLHIFKGSVCHPNKKKATGFINLDLGENTCPVEVFFIPEIANLAGSQHAGRRVEFTLAFTIKNGYEAFHVTSLRKYKCTNYPCGACVEITSAEEFAVCCACGRPVYRNDYEEEED